jgi:hypothetical protein
VYSLAANGEGSQRHADQFGQHAQRVGTQSPRRSDGAALDRSYRPAIVTHGDPEAMRVVFHVGMHDAGCGARADVPAIDARPGHARDALFFSRDHRHIVIA